jgi:hypothetical protein
MGFLNLRPGPVLIFMNEGGNRMFTEPPPPMMIGSCPGAIFFFFLPFTGLRFGLFPLDLVLDEPVVFFFVLFLPAFLVAISVAPF